MKLLLTVAYIAAQENDFLPPRMLMIKSTPLENPGQQQQATEVQTKDAFCQQLQDHAAKLKKMKTALGETEKLERTANNLRNRMIDFDGEEREAATTEHEEIFKKLKKEEEEFKNEYENYMEKKKTLTDKIETLMHERNTLDMAEGEKTKIEELTSKIKELQEFQHSFYDYSLESKYKSLEIDEERYTRLPWLKKKGTNQKTYFQKLKFAARPFFVKEAMKLTGMFENLATEEAAAKANELKDVLAESVETAALATLEFVKEFAPKLKKEANFAEDAVEREIVQQRKALAKDWAEFANSRRIEAAKTGEQ